MTYKAIGAIPVGKEPKDVAIDPDLNLGLIVNEKDYNVSVIALNTYQVTGTVSVGQKPQAIDINPETHIAAVVNEKDNSITVINLLNWQTNTISVGKHPIDITINPLDNCALVISDEDRSLLLIDLYTNTVIKNYSLNKLPKGIAVNNFTNIAAVVDDKTDSLTLIQLPNPVPEIISLNPSTVFRGSSGESITIQGNKFIKTSSVTLLHATPYTLHAEFIDNHNLQINVTKELLINAGAYQITITNPSPDGGTSNPVNLQINNPIPTISTIDPLETKTGTQSLTLTIYGTGFFEDTEIYFGNIKKTAALISNTKLQLSLTGEDLKTAGEYEIIARNLSPGGGNSNKVIFTIKPSLEITIISPIDNSTINRSKTIVKGTFKSETKDIGIKVNSIIADITGNEWIANNIPLTTGTNTITATATDSYGNTDTKAITVYANDITQKVELTANITSGIPPLTISFSVSTSFTPVLYQMDYEGNGIIDYTGTTFEDISHTYTTEGIFYPTLTVTDNQGNTYSDTIAITVLSKTEIDTLLKGKWEGMKEALAVKDVEKAVSYFLSLSQERYRYLFTALSNLLPQIASDMQTIEMVYMEGGVAEYRIKRLEDVGEVTYYIYFVLDENGLWQIQQF